MIKAEVCNCNNILSSTIQIRKNHLNIRYAMNGTGKSTIASAIELRSRQEDLSPLKCFGGTFEPTCTLSEPINKVLLFNEDFVRSFVFQESEVIRNAFEVFIKTPEYEGRQKAVDERLKKIHLDIANNEELQQLVSTGKMVLSKFSTTKDGELQNRGTLKSITDSGSIFTLPKELQRFQPLMQKDYTPDWVGWKNDGAKYDANGICPFCSSDLEGDYQAKKKTFTSSYTKSNVKNIIDMVSNFDAVRDLMDPAKKDTLYDCIRQTKNEREIRLWLKNFYNELKFLVEEISDVQKFGSFQIKREDIPHLDAQLKELRVDISHLQIFNNKKVQGLIAFINTRIDSVITETETLKKEIGELKGLIGTAKEQAIKDINDFLSTADINYKFDLQDEAENSSKTTLSYVTRDRLSFEVEDINLHLSWGEKNAFALVLFMHYALSQDPQLIILDDPISSFDSNKKYAIISRLFSSKNKKRSFYRKTVLMLTHDLEPVIDYVINEKPTGAYVSAYFLQNKGGMISELEISDSDIRSLPKMLVDNARNDKLNKVHRVTSLRKFFEHMPDQPGQEQAYNLLSSLLHCKPKPTRKDDSEMEKGDIAAGESLVKQYIPDFDYAFYSTSLFSKEALLKIITDDPNSYFRLQAFRVLLLALNLKPKIDDDTLMKYIDEQFHVENDYIFALDLLKYDTVPDFVVPRTLEFLKKEHLIS
ncbi:hypothetical protein ASJ33_04220 [Dehalococcoides mccartyi]|uniref:AAA family ATPase n=1 Tax=Dehalococcoides mccartyi TaxID=61435 RepID=UPI00090BE236|nr:AAA family ATPase [Dehalococcoides mccartyi]APH12409.1 hypothetical protein ASJ33_04220 [Dehalococcoides mccartyi]